MRVRLHCLLLETTELLTMELMQTLIALFIDQVIFDVCS